MPRSAATSEFGADAANWGGRRSPNVTRELAIMLEAGQDLDRALRFLVETAPNARCGRVLTALRDSGARRQCARRRAGRGIRRASRALYIGLVRAGEAGGTLAPTLERLADAAGARAQPGRRPCSRR